MVFAVIAVVVTTVCVVIVIPQLVLQAIVILKDRNTYDTPFYTLYIFDGVMNIITIINGYYLLKIPALVSADGVLAFLYLNNDGYSVRISNLISYHMAYVQWSSTAVLCLYRVTEKRIGKVWKQKTFLAAVMLVICVLPFVDTSRTFFYRTEFKYIAEDDNFKLSSAMVLNESFKYLLPFMITLTIVSAVLLLIFYYSINGLESMSSNTSTLGLRVIYYMLAVIMVQLCGTVLTGLRIYFGDRFGESKFLWELLPIISDCLSLMQPMLLTIFSSKMRQDMLALIGWKSEAPSATSAAAQQPTNSTAVHPSNMNINRF